MEIKLAGDREIETLLSFNDKALKVNLNNNIYGTFSEIGAGQETVRHFFRAGGSSKTIAKAMSAYDKDFSDSIYGEEAYKRYVTEGRLRKMLVHEKKLIEERLDRKKHPEKLFFSFANTVATIDFEKKNKGHGWVGITFQLDPNEAYNEIILHINFLENDSKLQQETLGNLGVNLIYGAFYYHKNPLQLLKSLYDHIEKDQIEIDTINFSGPQFKDVDNRLMSLYLVKNGMTQAVIFNSKGHNVFPADLLYGKNILALRGSFRPVTKVNMSMLSNSWQKFISTDPNITEQNSQVIFEITLSNLLAEGAINEQDFLDRADLLCALGQTVMISNFPEYYKLINYFTSFPIKKIGLAIGVPSLHEIFEEKFYTNLSGGVLEAIGKIYYKNLDILLYPMLDEKNNEIVNSKTFKLSPKTQALYNLFLDGNRIIDVENYDVEDLKIKSRKVLRMIRNNESGWENMLPEGIATIIKNKQLFTR
ncbi:TonB-dependent receptor [Flavobacterium agricola]|uniref:TonB-dependent receptor n=1 Tax=Flavobacterium agricola TaxID=2870839 RepID=A0ABY6M1J3_9FLAO|nr:TonB-dependent receptor [Flavobacterium agricola]UYW02437.1 TonB-dependent receptor [Flavobacterium agricola]